MSRKSPERHREEARRRIARVRERITALDVLCSGTLQRRTKLCGREACRCARDPDARHGPYWEWGRMKEGKLVNRMISPEEAAVIRRGIANYRKARALLRAWEVQTARLAEAEKRQK